VMLVVDGVLGERPPESVPVIGVLQFHAPLPGRVNLLSAELRHRVSLRRRSYPDFPFRGVASTVSRWLTRAGRIPPPAADRRARGVRQRADPPRYTPRPGIHWRGI